MEFGGGWLPLRLRMCYNRYQAGQTVLLTPPPLAQPETPTPQALPGNSLMTVFFIQFQKQLPDFSDAVADPTLYESLDEALAAFDQACGHRRLYACLKQSIPLEETALVLSGTAIVLKQV